MEAEAQKILTLPPEDALQEVVRLLLNLHTLRERSIHLAKMLAAERLKTEGFKDMSSFAGVDAAYEFTETPGTYKEDTKMPAWEVEAALKERKRITSNYFPRPTPVQDLGEWQSEDDQSEPSSSSSTPAGRQTASSTPGA